MLDDEIANRVVKKCIRIVGGLGTSHPIEMQDALGELLITNDQHLISLRVRITEEVARLDPPFQLDVGFLQGIDRDSTVGEVAEIVALQSERVPKIEAARTRRKKKEEKQK